MIRKVRIRRFGHVEHNGDDTHWIEHCVTMESESEGTPDEDMVE